MTGPSILKCRVPDGEEWRSGSFIQHPFKGVVLADPVGAPTIRGGQEATLLTQGQVIVVVSSAVAAGSPAYVAPNGAMSSNADGGRNREIGTWMSESNDGRLATLLVDLHKSVLVNAETKRLPRVGG